MKAIWASDKNGAAAIFVSGDTTEVAQNTLLAFHVGERVFNAGLLSGENTYARALPDMDADTIELWTTEKHAERLLDSCQVEGRPQPEEVESAEAEDASEE